MQWAAGGNQWMQAVYAVQLAQFVDFSCSLKHLLLLHLPELGGAAAATTAAAAKPPDAGDDWPGA